MASHQKRILTNLILLFIIGIGSCSSEDCENAELNSCLQKIKPLMTENPGLSPLSPSQEKAALACSTFETGMRCMDDYASRCFKAEQRALYDRTVYGAKEAMKELCSYNKINTGNHNCFGELSSSMNYCSLPLHRLRQRQPYQENHNLSDLCCAEWWFLSCVTAKLRKICDPTAVSKAIKIAEIVSTPELLQQCRSITVADCSGSGTMTWPPLPLLAFLVMLQWCSA